MGRADGGHGRPDGRPLKAGTAVVDLVRRVAGGQRHPGGAGRAGADRLGGRHVEVSLMDSALTCLLNQGSAVVAAGVPGAGAATATRASSPTRPTRPPTVPGRGRRQRPHVRAVVRRGRAGTGRALRDEHVAGGSNADELVAALEAVLRNEPAAHWLERLRAAKVPRGRSTRSTRRSRSPRSWAWSRRRWSTACP